jgi:hypothetical protein
MFALSPIAETGDLQGIKKHFQEAKGDIIIRASENSFREKEKGIDKNFLFCYE